MMLKLGFSGQKVRETTADDVDGIQDVSVMSTNHDDAEFDKSNQ